MTDATIPDEAVQVAAQTLHEHVMHDAWDNERCNDTGDGEYQSCKERYIERARAALQAAAPAIRAAESARADRLHEHTQALTRKLEQIRRLAEAQGADGYIPLDAIIQAPAVERGYEAVYAVIRAQNKSDRPSTVEVNALIWRCVSAFLESHRERPRPPRDARPHRRWCVVNRAEVAAELHDASQAMVYEQGREFDLVRHQDPTGISGTGVVADGIQFADGTVVLRGREPHPSIVVWPSIDEVTATHGHSGLTTVRWRA